MGVNLMKIRKIISFLAVAAFLFTALAVGVSAAVLEVDVNSPMFFADTWQNNEGNDEVCPLIYAFEVTRMPPSGTPNYEVRRYSGSVNVNQDMLEGEQVIINGSATNSVTFPFVETVVLDRVTWKWNNGMRQFFFFVYTSMDGENWTEIDIISDNVRRGSTPMTFDDFGDLGGPAVENVNISAAPGTEDDDEPLPITFVFAPGNVANYIRFTFFGSDGGQEVDEVNHPWISFNSLSFEGSIYIPTEDEPAPEITDEETPIVPVVTTPAPQTADPITLIALGSLVSAAGILITKKRK